MPREDIILAGFGEVKETTFERGQLKAEAWQLNGEINVLVKLIQKYIGENICSVQNQGEYVKWYGALK